MAKNRSYITADANVSKIQNMLIQPFRMYDQKSGQWTPFGQAALAGGRQLHELWKNPGSVNPNISGAIAPLVAAESDRIQRTGANQLTQAAGTMARTGTGGGMYAALEAALNRANSRDIAGAKRAGVAQSEGLRRQDLGTLLQTLQYVQDQTMSSRNAIATRSNLNLAFNQNKNANQAANLSTWGSALNTLGSLYLNYQTGGAYGAATQGYQAVRA